MKKLPKIFHQELSLKTNNNKKIYNSLEDNSSLIDNKENEKNKLKENLHNLKTVKEKIKELINGNDYIFNKEVTLIFEDSSQVCHIAGVVNNHIITMDNEIIKIDNLKDIEY